jgi:hypothetical protein
MMARVAVLRFRVSRDFTLEIRAREVIQQQVIVELKQLAQALLKMLLQGRLVRQ